MVGQGRGPTRQESHADHGLIEVLRVLILFACMQVYVHTCPRNAKEEALGILPAPLRRLLLLVLLGWHKQQHMQHTQTRCLFQWGTATCHGATKM